MIAGLVEMVPQMVGFVLMCILYACYAADVVVTAFAASDLARELDALEKVADSMHAVSDAMTELLGTTAMDVDQKMDESRLQLKLAAAEARDNAAKLSPRDAAAALRAKADEAMEAARRSSQEARLNASEAATAVKLAAKGTAERTAELLRLEQLAEELQARSEEMRARTRSSKYFGKGRMLRAYPNAWRSWPRNYGGNYGDGSDLPLWNGLARSLNTIAVRVGDLVGASNIFNFVYNTLQLNTLDPTNDVGLAQMVMGSQTKGVTPMALAAAFQIFYDGEYTTPHLYTRVLDRDGNIYLENNATSYQALTPDTAYVMNRLLKNVLFSSVGTASGRYPNSNGMEAFGKTGTASDEKDLWFVGGTPYYVTAVWWGYDAPYDMTNTLGKNQAKTRTCVTAWKAYMEQVQANLPYKAFPTSDGVVERAYCTQSGLLAGANCPSRATGYYRADDLPDTCTYSHAAPQAAAPAENTDDAVPAQPVIPTDTSALDTE